MKTKKLLLVIFILILIITGLSSCKSTSEEIPQDEVKIELPKLDSISLDGGYSIEFDKDTLEYNITLPSGRPRLPKVSATASQEYSLEVYQAVIPDTSDSGYAEIRLTSSEATAVYKVNMTKKEENGFVLQYDDRYKFVPDYKLQSGESLTFESDNEKIVSVENDGTITALAVSSTPVTVTAKVNGNTVDTLKINMIEKAQVSLFFIMGQSNAQGCYDYTEKEEKDAQRELIDMPANPGQVYSYDTFPRDGEAPQDKLYDMTQYKRAGMASSLGKNWYEKTGEKVVFLQTAYSGSPIESWLDPKRHKEDAGTYSSNNFYLTTQKAYKKLEKLLTEDKYDINRRYAYWLQGETAMGYDYDKKSGNYATNSSGGMLFTEKPAMTAQKYQNYFMMMYSDMKDDFKVDFMGIVLVRALKRVSSEKSQALGLLTDLVPIRVSQYTLHNTHSDIAIVSRIGDIAVTEENGNKNTEGYGYMGPKDLHYNQIGHNANGVEAALNTAARMTPGDKSVNEIELIKDNGRDRFKEGEQILLEHGKTQQIAATVLPIYANATLSFSSSDTNVATINEYGLITAIAKGSATITAQTNDGTTKTITIRVW